MINKLWTDVSLENYNNWYPLTGKIIETPQQYINTWPNVKDWFTTFAIRAQNDINAYLNFILSKFPFDSFKDELIKETLRDMVYVCVEHWVFNRTPIEFNVDATIQFNNGTSFSANSIPSINVWDLAPSRMKIWARLTELKQIFSSYNNDEIDIEKIDLKAFYTRNQVDELIKEQKAFTLSKQIKLYDYLVNDNENEIYRGPITNFINKGYVATEYDPKTETMILDWPDEIGTLPPEALQNNPQVGDFTHAATADFSAKQQKRITTNENEITKLNSELIKINENIDDIKNNWFNIATSPLWKKINNEEIIVNQWYIIDWIYTFMDNNQIFTSVNKLTKTNVRVSGSTEQNHIVIENIDVDIADVILWYDFDLRKFTATSTTTYYETIIYNIYQYIGKGTPTEFIAEDNTEHDYYTKIETNELLNKKQDKLKVGSFLNINENNIISINDSNLFCKGLTYNYNCLNDLKTTNKTIVGAINENKTNIDKKQNKLTAGTNITIDDNNVINATGGSVDENKIFNNKDDKDNTTRLVNEIIKTNVGGKTLIYRNNPNVTDDKDIPNKKYVDDELIKIKDLIKKLVVWKTIGERIDDRTWSNFSPSLNALYRVFLVCETSVPLQNGYKEVIFFTPAKAIGTGIRKITTRKIGNSDAVLNMIYDNTKWTLKLDGGDTGGAIYRLEELKAEDLYEIKSNTLEIKSPEVIDFEKPIKINSKTLLTKEIRENEWEINLKESPTPTPYPKWKDVAISLSGNSIHSYQLKSNTFYKIFYDLNPFSTSTFGKTPTQIIEIFWQPQTSSNWVCFLPSLKRISYINIVNNKLIKLITDQGYLWKLQELQE
ncbi:hypothetical protein [Spiroplasma endosymbiont of Polydrusus pterygomalis]|uniref:hypothetical protein n=1 Tax=Spiroplasma endosymbiont of Polydrusus pterygomalis TaxID=3139327 RepID=UPI003CCAF06D